jgi:hypothetical protein
MIERLTNSNTHGNTDRKNSRPLPQRRASNRSARDQSTVTVGTASSRAEQAMQSVEATMPASRNPRRGALVESSFWNKLQDDVVLAIFAWVALQDPKAMLTAVPAVCRRWRALCWDTRDVRFDLTFLPPQAKLRQRSLGAADGSALVASLAALAPRFKHVVECNMKDVLQEEEESSEGFTTTSASLVVADICVMALSECCPTLTTVDFSFCGRLSDASVVALAENCPQLTDVSLSKCSRLTDASVAALARNCHQLAAVSFCYCPELTDASVVELAEECPQLTSVDFSECSNLTDTSVVALAEHCPQLTQVHFDAIIAITDKSVVALAKHCPKLETVTFGMCDEVTDASVVALSKHCPNLTDVSFNECYQLTDKSVVALAKHCLKLASVNSSFDGDWQEWPAPYF